MELSLQTFTTMLNGMAAAAQAAASTALDLLVGSTLRAIFEAVAGLSLWLQWQNVQVLQMARLATASGTDCDSFVADFPLFGGRLTGVASSGPVNLGRYTATQAVQVPVGTLVKTNDGTQSFTVTLDTGNAAYQADPSGATQGWFSLGVGITSLNVSVTNNAVGTAGNVLAGTIGLIASSAPGLDTVTNESAFTNGMNAEADAALKARFALWFSSLSKGTPAAIDAAVADVAQNLTWSQVNNYDAGGNYAPGTVTVVIDDGSGATPSSTVALAATAVQAVRAATINAYVIAATPLTATINMTLITAANTSHAAAVTAVQAALASYIGGLAVGAALPYTRLAQLAYDASGAITNITGLTLNGGTADLAPTSYQVVRAGNVTVA
jgi:uncharacterized phage protein gp47/JayE